MQYTVTVMTLGLGSVADLIVRVIDEYQLLALGGDNTMQLIHRQGLQGPVLRSQRRGARIVPDPDDRDTRL